MRRFFTTHNCVWIAIGVGLLVGGAVWIDDARYAAYVDLTDCAFDCLAAVVSAAAAGACFAMARAE